MAPKADASKKTASKAKSGPPKHAPFLDMIKDAILNLKERNGSSRQAIKKYIQANNNLGGLNESSFNNHISRALSTGEENGVFDRPKGPSGPVKLKKGAPKTATEKKEAKPKAAAAKKSTAATTKKAPAAKKASTTTKKAPAAKKTAAAKPKANASKPRAKKAAAAPNAAPAVGEEKSVVLGKTKSGRVTKSKAPQASKPAAKKAGAKKAAPKKAPAKKATPKKAEAAS